jgi:hypothetical protein
MVRVKMSDKEVVYIFRTNPGLRHTNYDPAATVEQEPLVGHFDKNG